MFWLAICACQLVNSLWNFCTWSSSASHTLISYFFSGEPPPDYEESKRHMDCHQVITGLGEGVQNFTVANSGVQNDGQRPGGQQDERSYHTSSVLNQIPHTGDVLVCTSVWNTTYPMLSPFLTVHIHLNKYIMYWQMFILVPVPVSGSEWSLSQIINHINFHCFTSVIFLVAR